MKSIKYWRKKAGLTQSELAVLADVSEITIRRWENTEQNPSWDDIKKLCSVLNVSEAELLNGPQSKEISVKLILGKIKEVNDLTITLENNSFKLIMEGNALGMGGIATFADDDEFEATVTKIVNELRRGWKFIKENR